MMTTLPTIHSPTGTNFHGRPGPGALRTQLSARISHDEKNSGSEMACACTTFALGTIASAATGAATYYKHADVSGEQEGAADRHVYAEHKALVNSLSVFGATIVLGFFGGALVGAAHGCFEGTKIAH